MIESLHFLEASFGQQCSGRSRPPATAVALSSLLVLERREVVRLCKSPEITSALLLAKAVNHFAVEKKIPTLLVTNQPLITVLGVNLLLWRANIKLETVINPAWYADDFARLSVAASELAGAPLLVVGQMSFLRLNNRVHQVLRFHQTRCLIVDNPPPESFGQWRKLSCESGLPVTIVSSNSIA